MTVDGHTLWFSYDAHGPMYVKYDSSTYQYVTNLQGDIIAIVSNTGSVVVEYTYDAWGNILSTSGSMSATLGAYNPLRYRGYVYDSETELYYLQSRYYDPAMGRFINADSLVSTGQGILGFNMFAYCRNNPVNRVDITGAADVDYLDETDDAGLDHEEAGRPKGGDYFDPQQAILDGSFSGSYSYSVPQKAWDVLNFLKGHNMHPPQNHKGGKTFANDGRDNSQRLPDNGTTYRKYDIDPKVQGERRGAERIVIGSDGSAWYTPDHYISFIRME